MSDIIKSLFEIRDSHDLNLNMTIILTCDFLGGEDDFDEIETNIEVIK